MIAKGLIHLIRAYQLLTHCLCLRNCRFYPSCSCYAVDAIRKHGPIKGTWMAIKRILRCSPLSPGGFDPT